MNPLFNARPVAFVLTADRSRSKPFYEQVLELPVAAEDGFAVTFRLGECASLRLTDLPGHVAQPHTVLGWEVADIAAAMADLRAKGVTFTIYEGLGQDEDGVWKAPDGGASVCWFADPDGNVLGMTEFG